MKEAKYRTANRLRFYRLQLGLEQREVAYLLGLKSATRISEWEQGTKIPSLKNLLLLSFIYKTLPDELYFEFRQSLMVEYRKRYESFAQYKDSG